METSIQLPAFGCCWLTSVPPKATTHMATLPSVSQTHISSKVENQK